MGGALTIRPIADGEEAAVIALWQACGLTRPWNDPARDLAFARGGPASDVLVGLIEDQIAASLMVGHDGHRGIVYYLSVDPAHQRQGLGEAMMQAAERWLLDRGVWKVNLFVRHGNEPVLAFYDALGYEPQAISLLGKWIDPSKKGGSAKGTAIAGQALLPAMQQRHVDQRTPPKPGRWMTPEPRSWWRVVKRTAIDFVDDQILLIAAGVTFYGLLALVPALAALIALYGLFFDPSDVPHHVSMLSGFLPSEAVSFIADQSQRIAAQSRSTLGAAFLIGLVFSLWSAMSGVTAIFSGLNIAYGEREKRSFVSLYTQALLFTAGALVFLLLALAGLAVVPVVIGIIGGSSMLASLLDIGRWPAMVAVLVATLAVLYRFGPSREHPRWRFIVFGTAAATLGWVAFSLLFSWYVTNIASYNRTYGSLGALIAFMTWMWLSTTIVLLGAELNAKVESETRKVKPAE